jgi:hypothetical protein
MLDLERIRQDVEEVMQEPDIDQDMLDLLAEHVQTLTNEVERLRQSSPEHITEEILCMFETAFGETIPEGATQWGYTKHACAEIERLQGELEQTRQAAAQVGMGIIPKEDLSPDNEDLKHAAYMILSACPFCGGSALTHGTYNPATGIYGYTVSCVRCMASTIYTADTRDGARAGAIKRWEQRKDIQRFVDRVNRRAEANMEKTGRLEGAHYAAMQSELAAMKAGGL